MCMTGCPVNHNRPFYRKLPFIPSVPFLLQTRRRRGRGFHDPRGTPDSRHGARLIALALGASFGTNTMNGFAGKLAAALALSLMALVAQASPVSELPWKFGPVKVQVGPQATLDVP